jgi:hypothetical protein
MPRAKGGPARNEKPTLEALLANTRREGECRIWLGSTDSHGYARCCFGGRWHPVHRLVCAMVHGLPDGLLACHHCDVPLCIEPTHIYAGTPKDNRHDSMRRGRDSKPPLNLGVDHHSAKLTPQIVREIRRRWQAGEQITALAVEHGVHKGAIWKIVHRKSWKTA